MKDVSGGHQEKFCGQCEITMDHFGRDIHGLCVVFSRFGRVSMVFDGSGGSKVPCELILSNSGTNSKEFIS